DTYFASMETTALIRMGDGRAPETSLCAKESAGGRKEDNQWKATHITDDDVDQMKYLKLLSWKLPDSTLRLSHFTRVLMQDANVMGFDIAKGTRVYINTWAIARDPKVWDNRTCLMNLCPKVAVVEKTLANLLCKFDLTLPNGVKLKDLDMGETFGLAI
nr:cytochrome P450 71A8-like [Tanacetum cinerariifolium]